MLSSNDRLEAKCVLKRFSESGRKRKPLLFDLTFFNNIDIKLIQQRGRENEWVGQTSSARNRITLSLLMTACRKKLFFMLVRTSAHTVLVAVASKSFPALH